MVVTEHTPPTNYHRRARDLLHSGDDACELQLDRRRTEIDKEEGIEHRLCSLHSCKIPEVPSLDRLALPLKRFFSNARRIG